MDWKRFFDRLGMDGSRWQWRMMRWERQLRSLLSGSPSPDDFSVTKFLIIVNVTLFVIMVLFGVMSGLGLQTVLNPNTYLLIHVGAQVWPEVLANGEWWRCITYAYTHGGLIHLAFNMLVLYQVGPMIEREIGAIRYFVLYTMTALTATFAGFIWQAFIIRQWIPVVGASGSLFGLFGFAIVYCHRLGPPGKFMRDFMLRWIIIAFLFGLFVGADNAAHLGGAIGGAIFGFFTPLGVRGQTRMRGLFNTLGGVSLAATTFSLLFLVLSWFTRGGT